MTSSRKGLVYVIIISILVGVLVSTILFQYSLLTNKAITVLNAMHSYNNYSDFLVNVRELSKITTDDVYNEVINPDNFVNLRKYERLKGKPSDYKIISMSFDPTLGYCTITYRVLTDTVSADRVFIQIISTRWFKIDYLKRGEILDL